MTELERLKGNLDVLHKAYHLSGMSGKIYLLIDRERDIIRQRIADLEAQEQVDPWQRARGCVDYALKHYLHNSNGREIALYARHLEAKVAELEHELRCERIDGGKVRDDRKAIDAEKNREKLAELTTIANAIPLYRLEAACGLARELVEKRIEGVKKEMQGNGKG